MLAYLGADNSASSIVGFQPTILKQLGYTSSQAQIHTIPVYIASLVCLNLSAYFSDRLKHRYGFLLLGAAVGIVGWSIELAGLHNTKAKYFGMFAIAAGAYMQMPLLVVWLNNNMGGNARSAFGTGFMIGIGNCGNLISSNVFITEEAPKYPTGFGTGLGLTFLSVVCATIMAVCLWLGNRRRERGQEDRKLALGEERVAKLGDEHPDFRYVI
jgi:MFS family permease